MREHGCVEGKTSSSTYRFGENRAERLPGMASELIGAKVDLIVATSAVAAIAAKKATTTIPVGSTGLG